jgi:D-erythronate 2-dehydrogenase
MHRIRTGSPNGGRPAVLALFKNVRHVFASPSAAVEFFPHAATIDGASVGPRRNISLPGLSATVGDEIAALERVAGPEASALIRREPDETIRGIVAGWAPDVEAFRARALGFRADTSFDYIIRAHLAETGPSGGDDPEGGRDAGRR